MAAIRPAAVLFREWASAHATEEAAADCELALVEACNNLVNHNPGHAGAISIHAVATPFDLTINIHDTTAGFEWPADVSLPEPDAERGRGIFLMHTLMTQVEYKRRSGINELKLRRAL